MSSRNDSGGLLVAFLGALFGLQFPRVVLGLVVLFVLFVVGRVVWSVCSEWWDEQTVVSEWESALMSWYYRFRVRVFLLTGKLE